MRRLVLSLFKKREMNKELLTLCSWLVVLALPGTSFAGLIIGSATGSWGSATVERGGSDIPFTVGMNLEDGDVIKTERNSGAVYELYDRNGVPIVEEEIFGLPGAKGCADADGERGKAKVEIKGRNLADKRKVVSKIEQGTIKAKTKPGGEDKAKYYEIIAKDGIAKKKGTEYAITYDLGSNLTSLSTLDGIVEFDNIEYASLPDLYFTDPSNKSDATLNLDAVLILAGGTASVSDLLGAGNTVEVSGGYYSLVASPPSSPLSGLAPIHALPGGLSPEPGTLILLGLGGLAMLKRRQ